MRGTIRSYGASDDPGPADPPLCAELGLDDSLHETAVIPSQMPSAWREPMLNRALSDEYKSREYYLSTPQLNSGRLAG
jgi:hypothetical protein